MKIVWVLVILIIIGVAVFAIRKRIGDVAQNEEKSSDNIKASNVETVKQSIVPQLSQTFEQKLADVYSGVKPATTALNDIRTDSTLTTEQKDKLEFEAIMQRFWPERMKAATNRRMFPNKLPKYPISMPRGVVIYQEIRDKWYRFDTDSYIYWEKQNGVFPRETDLSWNRKPADVIFYSNEQFTADSNRLKKLQAAYPWVNNDLRVLAIQSDIRL